ncbi:high-potential iron-sulfur protein [Dokdonella sp.]|uniref:high-potential iron-sulfur protein n=1 Tax=Dokdonella sp. TaxID=2291710 RepID=UPI003784FCAD
MSDPANRQARRRFLKIAVVGAAMAPVAASLLPRIARADTPHVDPKDPTAAALGYTEDAATAKGDPSYKPNSNCANCNFFKGHSEMAYGPCDLFPGKDVNAKGWCRSWTAKA